MFHFIYLFAASGPCSGGGFLAFPTWYKYLPGSPDANGLCTPQITGLNDIWLIVAAVIEILLRVAGMAAVGFVIYGGFELMISRGEPDKTSRARQTILNAIVGLVIAILSSAIINFIAGRIS